MDLCKNLILQNINLMIIKVLYSSHFESFFSLSFEKIMNNICDKADKQSQLNETIKLLLLFQKILETCNTI